MLRELELRAEKQYVPPLLRALVYAGLGEKRASLEVLEERWRTETCALLFC